MTKQDKCIIDMDVKEFERLIKSVNKLDINNQSTYRLDIVLKIIENSLVINIRNSKRTSP